MAEEGTLTGKRERLKVQEGGAVFPNYVAECMVQGCPNEGRNKIGVRCRVWHHMHPNKKKTDSLWAPDTDAYLCDEHALAGGRVTIMFEPDDSEEITVQVVTRAGMKRRIVPIR